MTLITGSTEPAVSETGEPSEEVVTSWTDSLSDDYKEHQSLSTFKSVDDLAKSYIHAQGLIGKDKVIIPTDSSTPEEVAEFYGKLGMPTPEEYKVEGVSDELKEAFLKHNILPNQAAGLKEVFDGLIAAQDTTDADYDAAVQAEMESLKEEWGESFEGNIQRAANAFKVFGNEETAKYLEDTGLGNDPTLLKLFSNIGAKLGGEDTFKGQAQPDMTKDAAKARINTLYADTAGPLYDKSSPKHKDVLKELEALSLIANS